MLLAIAFHTQELNISPRQWDTMATLTPSNS